MGSPRVGESLPLLNKQSVFIFLLSREDE